MQYQFLLHSSSSYSSLPNRDHKLEREERESALKDQFALRSSSPFSLADAQPFHSNHEREGQRFQRAQRQTQEGFPLFSIQFSTIFLWILSIRKCAISEFRKLWFNDGMMIMRILNCWIRFNCCPIHLLRNQSSESRGCVIA